MKKLLPVLLILLLSTVAFAQNKGRIVGTITTDDGAVIPGVKVTIASDALIAREMSTVSNDRGMFRFVLLPIGNYSIKFEREGYSTVEQSGLQLAFASTLTLNKVMKPSDFEEVISITGEAPIVDKTSSAVSDKLDLEFLQNMPNTRNAWSMPNLSAGFTNDSAMGGIQRSGNALNMDGAIIHDPTTKTVFASVNMEAIEQVDVAMFGSNAEYHSFTGASLNMITKSGGNEFSGEANYFFQSTEWVSDNTERHADDGVTLPTASRLSDPNFSLGGPIIKDRIWFFGNFNYQKEETQREILTGFITQVEDPKRLFLKLSSRWDERNISYFSYTWYERDRSHRTSTGTWRQNIENSLYQQVSDGNTYLLQHSFVLTDDIIIEGRWSSFDGGFDLTPRVDGPMLRDYPSGNMLPDSKLGKTDKTDRPRDTFLGTMNYYNDQLSGSHSMKFGLEYENNKSNREFDHRRYFRIRNGVNYRWYDYGAYSGGRVVERIGGFAQDSWSVNDKLTLNLGFRYDSWWSSANDPEDGGLAGADTFRKMKDPAYRLGFAYDLFGDGKTIMRGFVGRYYEGLVSGNINPMITSVPPTTQYRWNGSEWYVYSVSGGSQPGAYYLDPDTENQYTEGIMVGVERELNQNMSGSFTFVYKHDKNQIGEVYPNGTWEEGTASFSNQYGSYNGVYYYDYRTANPETYTNPHKGDHGVLEEPFRKYWGYIFDFKKRMSVEIINIQ